MVKAGTVWPTKFQVMSAGCTGGDASSMMIVKVIESLSSPSIASSIAETSGTTKSKNLLISKQSAYVPQWKHEHLKAVYFTLHKELSSCLLWS